MKYYKFSAASWQTKGKKRRAHPYAQTAPGSIAAHTYRTGRFPVTSWPQFAMFDNPPVFDHFILRDVLMRNYRYNWDLLDLYYLSQELTAVIGYLVSPKLKSIMEKFAIYQPCQFYSAKLLYKNNFLDYYLFQLGSHLPIDYARSKYKVRYEDNQKEPVEEPASIHVGSEIGILDRASFFVKMDECRESNQELLFFEKVINELPDLAMLDGEVIISSPMKEALEEANISGIWYEEFGGFTVHFLPPPTV
ncbi:hypothetical protein P1X15_18060 [Runella sp. MFBS21]|uniref:hypothetical protein n=1 Tax=Runella sp. MFBS21 TaxID=3034018 RepID=UPI0023FA27AE|nr:hypothetical protein [Runella sp. MFBS21]MDF7819529.1 hypothetical protein [Runella sp. MFBS21]